MACVKCIAKFVKRLILTVVVLVVVLVGFVLCGGLGPVVKYVGVPVANRLGIPLSIERCVILPLGGYVRLEGVRVANPTAFVEANPGVYGESALAQVGNLEVDVGVRTLFAEELVVDSLELTGLRVLYAFDQETTNVDALLAQMGMTGAEAAEPAPAPETPVAEETPAGEPRKVRLARVHFEDNSVSIRKFLTIPVALPPMTLENIDNYALQERLIAVLAPVMVAISSAGDGLGAGMDKLGAGLEKVGSTSGALGKEAGALSEGVLNAGSGALDSIGSGLGALMGSAEETAPEEAKQPEPAEEKPTLKESVESTRQEFRQLRKDLKGLMK